jgi:hypothetical protein
MNLAKMEKRILTFILDQYPNTSDFTADDKYPMAEGCPLPTRVKVVEAYPDASSDQLDAALARLVALKLVQDVYLYLDNEVALIKLHAGKPTKMPVAEKGAGPIGYQATAFGETTRNNFWDKWLRNLGKDFAESMAKEHGAKVVAAIAGFGLAVVLALFGVDMRAWFGKDQPKEQPPAANTKSADQPAK